LLAQEKSEEQVALLWIVAANERAIREVTVSASNIAEDFEMSVLVKKVRRERERMN
jgi:hypothetical protein